MPARIFLCGKSRPIGLLGSVCFLSGLFLTAAGIRDGASAVLNLVPNGGFEQDAGGAPASWNLEGYWEPNSEKTEILLDASVRAEGRYSLKIALKSEIGKQELQVRPPVSARVRSAVFDLKGNGWYRIRGWVKAVNFKANSYAIVYFVGKTTEGKDWFAEEYKIRCSEYWLERYGNWMLVDKIVRIPSSVNKGMLTLGAAFINMEDGKTPALYFDDMRVEEFVPPPAPGQAWTYAVFTCYGQGGKTVEDKEAQGGFSYKKTRGKDSAGGMVSGPAVKDQVPGIYEVVFRMKTDDNRSAEEIADLSVIAATDGFIFNAGDLARKIVCKQDFPSAQKYQDFSFYFEYPAGYQIQFPCAWKGSADLWLDTVTIRQLKAFTDQEVMEHTTIPVEYGELNQDSRSTR
jgi:hypothetical protein